MEAAPGCRDVAAGMRQAAAGDSEPAVRAPPSPGSRGHPTRSQLVRVERRTPMGCCPTGVRTVRRRGLLRPDPCRPLSELLDRRFEAVSGDWAPSTTRETKSFVKHHLKPGCRFRGWWGPGRSPCAASLCVVTCSDASAGLLHERSVRPEWPCSRTRGRASPARAVDLGGCAGAMGRCLGAAICTIRRPLSIRCLQADFAWRLPFAPRSAVCFSAAAYRLTLRRP
jgi:hypothetical protein